MLLVSECWLVMSRMSMVVTISQVTSMVVTLWVSLLISMAMYMVAVMARMPTQITQN